MLKKLLKIALFIFLGILVLVITVVLFERYRLPRLSHLKTAAATIQPDLNDLEYLDSYERDRAWVVCGIDTGPEPCPSYFLRYKINRQFIVEKFDAVSKRLEENGWKEVKYPDSEKLCTLLRDNIDQFSQGIYGTVCERDFYKNAIKLKIYSARDSNEGPDTLSFNVRLMDYRHDH